MLCGGNPTERAAMGVVAHPCLKWHAKDGFRFRPSPTCAEFHLRCTEQALLTSGL